MNRGEQDLFDEERVKQAKVASRRVGYEMAVANARAFRTKHNSYECRCGNSGCSSNTDHRAKMALLDALILELEAKEKDVEGP